MKWKLSVTENERENVNAAYRRNSAVDERKNENLRNFGRWNEKGKNTSANERKCDDGKAEVGPDQGQAPEEGQSGGQGQEKGKGRFGYCMKLLSN